jgi:hypothetical protein
MIASSKKIGFVTGAMVLAFQSAAATGAGFLGAATGDPALAVAMRDTAAQAVRPTRNHRRWECVWWSMWL